MATVQILKDLGEQMGLKGTELRDFIKEQQDLEGEERNQQREHDRIEQDKQRESEKEQREREREKEQHEIECMKFERDKMDFELQMKATEVKSSEISEDEEGEDNKEGSVASGHTRQRIGSKGPKMPCFDERSDDMDSFLHRFEAYADSQRWSKGQWAVYLSALLKGKALEVYSRLHVKDAQDYEILKDALLKRFNLTEEGFKHHHHHHHVRLLKAVIRNQT